LDRMPARSPDAPPKAQLGNQPRALQHADGTRLGDVDHDPAEGQRAEDESDDAVIAGGCVTKRTVFAAYGHALEWHRSSS